MRAMILAAGKGERMRPLTEQIPKPLLSVADKPLIEHQLERLIDAGFSEFVINVSWLGQQIIDYLGDGRGRGVRIQYSIEETPLETAGGVVKALPLLGSKPFLLVNSDIWSDFDFRQILSLEVGARRGHLVLVANPVHHPSGDFDLRESLIEIGGATTYTYSGIGVYHPGFFAGYDAEPLPMRPLLDRAISEKRLSGSLFDGTWLDIGTPGRLRELNERLEKHAQQNESSL
ncbi:MAG: N-acetylmuramate alpha-1-phosphate uridylyltransferase MurU [Pseudomonadota bacterium]